MRCLRALAAASVLAVAVALAGCGVHDAGPPAFSRPASGADVASTPAATTAAPTSSPPTAAATTGPAATKAGSAAWSEDFSGAAGTQPDSTSLQFRTGGNGWGNQEVESYTDRSVNASLDGKGNLAIRAIRGSFTGTDNITRDWTSARVDSYGKRTFTTGTIAIRMKVPTGTGMWPAFWLLGTDLPKVGWPAAGEVDIAEMLGSRNDNKVYQSIHGPVGKTAYSHIDAVSAPTAAPIGAAFHVFSVTISKNRLVFKIDGKVTSTFTPADLKAGEKWVFNGPMFLTVNLAVGGWPGMPSASTPSPSTLLVDWIRYTP